MKKLKHALTLAVMGVIVSFSGVAHADPANFFQSMESSDLSSNIPLVIFAVAAIIVYLCNRPRVAVCARARRRGDGPRHEAR